MHLPSFHNSHINPAHEYANDCPLCAKRALQIFLETAVSCPYRSYTAIDTYNHFVIIFSPFFLPFYMHSATAAGEKPFVVTN